MQHEDGNTNKGPAGVHFVGRRHSTQEVAEMDLLMREILSRTGQKALCRKRVPFSRTEEMHCVEDIYTDQGLARMHFVEDSNIYQGPAGVHFVGRLNSTQEVAEMELLMREILSRTGENASCRGQILIKDQQIALCRN